MEVETPFYPNAQLKHNVEVLYHSTSQLLTLGCFYFQFTQMIYQQLHDARIEIVTDVEPKNLDKLDEGILELVNVYNGEITEVGDIAGITYATPRIPNDQLRPALEAAGKNVVLVGDCYSPRSLLAATRQGYQVGMEI